MNKLYSLILTLKDDEKAQDMVEYALLAGFVAVAAGRRFAWDLDEHQPDLQQDGEPYDRRRDEVARGTFRVPGRRSQGHAKAGSCDLPVFRYDHPL